MHFGLSRREMIFLDGFQEGSSSVTDRFLPRKEMTRGLTKSFHHGETTMFHQAASNSRRPHEIIRAEIAEERLPKIPQLQMMQTKHKLMKIDEIYLYNYDESIFKMIQL